MNIAVMGIALKKLERAEETIKSYEAEVAKTNEHINDVVSNIDDVNKGLNKILRGGV